jgi:hypothetical protein
MVSVARSPTSAASFIVQTSSLEAAEISREVAPLADQVRIVPNRDSLCIEFYCTRTHCMNEAKLESQ